MKNEKTGVIPETIQEMWRNQTYDDTLLGCVLSSSAKPADRVKALDNIIDRKVTNARKQFLSESKRRNKKTWTIRDILSTVYHQRKDGTVDRIELLQPFSIIHNSYDDETSARVLGFLALFLEYYDLYQVDGVVKMEVSRLWSCLDMSSSSPPSWFYEKMKEALVELSDLKAYVLLDAEKNFPNLYEARNASFGKNLTSSNRIKFEFMPVIRIVYTKSLTYSSYSFDSRFLRYRGLPKQRLPLKYICLIQGSSQASGFALFLWRELTTKTRSRKGEVSVHPGRLKYILTYLKKSESTPNNQFVREKMKSINKAFGTKHTVSIRRSGDLLIKHDWNKGDNVFGIE